MIMKTTAEENKKWNLLLILLAIIVGLITFVLSGCTIPKTEYKLAKEGNLTSFRVDDDGEYHFTTDNYTYHDIDTRIRPVTINRSNTNEPKLYLYYSQNNKGVWVANEFEGYIIELPYSYEIQTFDD